MKIRKTELKIIYDLMIVDGTVNRKDEAIMHWQSLSGLERKPYIHRMKAAKRQEDI